MAQLNMGVRILGLLVLIIAMVVLGIIWFDYLGVVSANQIFAPVLGLFGQKVETVDPDDPLLLDSIRLRRQEEALVLKYDELQTKEDGFSTREREFDQKLAELEEREKAQEEREKSFQDRVTAHDSRVGNLEQNARYLNSMPLAPAVEILESYDDQLLIDTLRIAQEIADREGVVSLVPTWLSRMKDKNRVADLQRKMTLKPDRDE